MVTLPCGKDLRCASWAGVLAGTILKPEAVKRSSVDLVVAQPIDRATRRAGTTTRYSFLICFIIFLVFGFRFLFSRAFMASQRVLPFPPWCETRRHRPRFAWSNPRPCEP